MEFSQLGLAEPLLRAVRDEGYTTCTPIQEQAIPPVLLGRDLLGCAQTGTGKTAAFALPILHRLAAAPARREGRPVRCLVLVPTRELASQVHASFRAYGKHYHFTSTVIFGGVGQNPQVQALRRGVDIVVACPGRLLDLVGQGHARFDATEVLVLDEADRMFDMGFLPDLRRIIALLPPKRQNLMFSATMPREIRDLAHGILHSPVSVSVVPESTAADTVDQRLYHVQVPSKQALLHHLLKDSNVTRALVFTRTKHGADKVVKHLLRANLSAAAIHGNKSQNARERALAEFRQGKLLVLVASDIAARGLDIDGISHVVNFDLPHEPETYVHRIGRTGRAGATGIAISFCTGEDRAQLAGIERILRRKVPVHPLPPFAALPPPPPSEHHGPRSFASDRAGPPAFDRKNLQRHGHGRPGLRNHGPAQGRRQPSRRGR